MITKPAPKGIFFKVVLSVLLVVVIIATGKSQRHGGMDTTFRSKTVSDVRKMLMGTWQMVDDSTIKINITADSIFYLRQNHNGIPTHHNRADAYTLTQTHCGASFVNSITGFYVVEQTMQYAKEVDSCLPIQVLNDNFLTLFQSIPQADIYSGALELRYNRTK